MRFDRKLLMLEGLLLCELGNAQATLQPNDWLDNRRLNEGGVQIHTVEQGRFEGRVLAAIEINASPEAIWAVMTDCASAPEFVPWVVECQLLESGDGGRTQTFQQQIKLAWYMPPLNHTFQLTYYPYRQIDFQRIAGSPRRFEGSWWLRPKGSRTQVIYSVDLIPGFLVPQGLARRALRKDLPATLNSLRKRAETH